MRVAVIGGGVIGTAAAYYLAKAGHAVTVLDRSRHGGGCSHGNCGYVCPSHVLPLAGPGVLASTLRALLARNGPLKVTPGALFANLGWFLGFARRCNAADQLAAAVGIRALLTSSRTLYDELLAAEDIPCEWDARGLLFVFQTQKALHHYAATDELLTERFATPADRFDADALLALEPALKPGAAAGGYLYRGDAQLRPDRLMSGWRAVLDRLGVTVRENVSVTALDGRVATTTAGDVPADAFVVTTGAEVGRLALFGRRLPVVPGKGYSLTMPRPAVCPTYPMIFEEHRVAVSPFASGYRIGSTMEFAGYDERVDVSRLQLLRDGAAAYLCEPVGEPVEETWAGLRPMTADGLPVIGRSPTRPNVWVAAGHGMLGLSMATGTGRLVAELVSGVTPHLDPTAYSPERFR